MTHYFFGPHILRVCLVISVSKTLCHYMTNWLAFLNKLINQSRVAGVKRTRFAIWMNYRYLVYGKGFFIVSTKHLRHREEGITRKNEFLNILSFIKYKKTNAEMTRYPLLLLIITFTQGIYNNIPNINPASRYRRAPKEGKKLPRCSSPPLDRKLKKNVFCRQCHTFYIIYHPAPILSPFPCTLSTHPIMSFCQY
jgi:hypothetical protein